MTRDVDSLGLLPGAIALVRDLVHERTGNYYDHSRLGQLADRLAPLVANRGFETFLDYYYLLKYDEASSEEWPRVMDALAVPETYFWREVDQLRAVADIIVPSLAAKLARPVRIWSVPCASGEEPLSLVMMLEARGAREIVEIEASDASPAALNAAAAGVYRERAFRALPLALKQRYFTEENGRWRIDRALVERIRWSRVNLLDTADVRRRAAADVILCRNVFIYFSESAIRRVVDVFADAMPAPGYLCVGAAESLLRLTDRFELEQIGEAFVYVKKGQNR
ncbi:MAG TPA: protein-glutamate O-methyltransferase CheR [Vicinamibacterales bacterium]